MAHCALLIAPYVSTSLRPSYAVMGGVESAKAS
jgi:hypothetical protein